MACVLEFLNVFSVVVLFHISGCARGEADS